MVRLVWMGFNQISEVEKSFVVADEINTGFQNKIPLWLFGFALDFFDKTIRASEDQIIFSMSVCRIPLPSECVYSCHSALLGLLIQNQPSFEKA
jgi:hypothetical protein